jgi:hypothetical protein
VLPSFRHSELSQSFPSAAAYTSAFRTLTALLKPKACDALKADADVHVKLAPTRKKGAPADTDFDECRADLLSGKLSFGKLLNRVEETEKAKRTTLAAAPTVSAPHHLEVESARANKARAVSLITQRIHEAKLRVATSASSVMEPDAWSEMADASMELFYIGAPNLAYLQQAIKAYNRVVSNRMRARVRGEEAHCRRTAAKLTYAPRPHDCACIVCFARFPYYRRRSASSI